MAFEMLPPAEVYDRYLGPAIAEPFSRALIDDTVPGSAFIGRTSSNTRLTFRLPFPDQFVRITVMGAAGWGIRDANVSPRLY